jgi:hypothetical protein
LFFSKSKVKNCIFEKKKKKKREICITQPHYRRRPLVNVIGSRALKMLEVELQFESLQFLKLMNLKLYLYS